MPPDTAIAVSHKAKDLENALRSVIRGKDDVIRLALVSILARGHLLIEGVQSLNSADFTCGVTLVTFDIKHHASFVIHAYGSS